MVLHEEGEVRPRGEGQSMREQDLRDVWLKDQIWFVVRDKSCSYDIDDPEAAVWTLSRSPGEPGWNTDSGYDGYGLKYADARELADAGQKGMTYEARFHELSNWARAEVRKLGPKPDQATQTGQLWLIIDELIRKLAKAETS